MDKLLYLILLFIMCELNSIFPFHVKNEDKYTSTYVMYQNIFLQ